MDCNEEKKKKFPDEDDATDHNNVAITPTKKPAHKSITGSNVKLIIGNFIKKKVDVRYVWAPHTLEITLNAYNMKHKLAIKNWDVSEFQVLKENDKRELVITLLAPPAFYCYAKLDQSKNYDFISCKDFTNGEAVKWRVIRLIFKDETPYQIHNAMTQGRQQEDDDTYLDSTDKLLFWSATKEEDHALLEEAIKKRKSDTSKQQFKKKRRISDGDNEALNVDVAEEESTGFQLFSELPKDITCEIMGWLDIQSLCTMSAVNKTFESLANKESLWQFHCRKFNVHSPLASCKTWKESYRLLRKIRCVACGAPGLKTRNPAARLLGTVLCGECKEQKEYRTIPLTHAMQGTSIARPQFACLRHTTVPSFNGGFIRYYLTNEVVALAESFNKTVNKEKLYEKKVYTGGHSMY